MKVYCLFEVIPYEGDYLIGIFFSEEGAKAELKRMKLGNGEQRYYERYDYTIAEWKVR
jgi:hypothetical protein